MTNIFGVKLVLGIGEGNNERTNLRIQENGFGESDEKSIEIQFNNSNK